MNGMTMTPPAGGDPFGILVVIAGAVATVTSIVLAIRWTAWPGETDDDHPKWQILRPDR